MLFDETCAPLRARQAAALTTHHLGDTSIPQPARVIAVCTAAARSRLTSPAITHFRATNSPGRVHFSRLLTFSDSYQRCRTCVTCRSVPCVHDSESVPGGTGRPATALAMLAASLREARRPFPTPPPPPREGPHGVHAPTIHLGKAHCPQNCGAAARIHRSHASHTYIRGTRERGREKKLSVLSCLLAYEQG